MAASTQTPHEFINQYGWDDALWIAGIAFEQAIKDKESAEIALRISYLRLKNTHTKESFEEFISASDRYRWMESVVCEGRKFYRAIYAEYQSRGLI